MAWHTRDGDEIWLDLDKYNLEETEHLLKLCKDGCEAELEEFEDLLKNGADPNSHYKNAWTPLTRASYCGKEDLVELLLRYHADINVVDQFGQTALHMACNKGNVEIVKTLIRGGATTYLNNEFNRTPLDEARQNDHIDVVKYFEERDTVTEDPSTDYEDKSKVPKTGEVSHSEASGDGTPGDELSRKDQSTPSPPDTEPSMPRCSAGLEGSARPWKDYPELCVRFLNKIPQHWTVRNGEPMKKDNILSWANEWHLRGGGLIPRFVEAKRGTYAQIRVKFNDRRMSNSVIGMRALNVPITEQTMSLDLYHGGSIFDEYKKHLVMHMFGHSLGLYHEHQSTNFWSCIRPYIDVEKMKQNLKVSDAEFAKSWGETDDFHKADYDPDSIMHY